MKKFLEIILKILAGIGVFLIAMLLVLGILFGYWYLRPNQARVDTKVVIESWEIVRDQSHNSNTDLVQWNGDFYLAYVSSPFHFGSSKLVMHVRRSFDLGRTWSEMTTFTAGNEEDIRDPKLTVIGERLSFTP